MALTQKQLNTITDSMQENSNQMQEEYQHDQDVNIKQQQIELQKQELQVQQRQQETQQLFVVGGLSLLSVLAISIIIYLFVRSSRKHKNKCTNSNI